MSTPLPRPDVTVSQSQEGEIHHTNITVSRDGKTTSITGSGSSQPAATGDAVRKFIEDRRNAEWFP